MKKKKTGNRHYGIGDIVFHPELKYRVLVLSEPIVSDGYDHNIHQVLVISTDNLAVQYLNKTIIWNLSGFEYVTGVNPRIT